MARRQYVKENSKQQFVKNDGRKIRVVWHCQLSLCIGMFGAYTLLVGFGRCADVSITLLHPARRLDHELGKRNIVLD
jgi:hypothetical protein